MASTVTELLRRRFGGKSLPYDAEIEYLGSSGTQYIDTGLIGDIDLNFEVTAKTNNVSSYYVILGDRASSNSRRYTLITSNSVNPTQEVYFTFNTSANQVTANGSVNNVLNFRTYKKDDLKCYINGTLKGTLRTATFTTPNNVILFGMRNNGTLANLLNGAISSCKFSKNGVLLRDFIPVRVGQIGYMYDKVSKQLFGNAGTGDFVLGPDK